MEITDFLTNRYILPNKATLTLDDIALCINGYSCIKDIDFVYYSNLHNELIKHLKEGDIKLLKNYGNYPLLWNAISKFSLTRKSNSTD
jgi:hypothetical protein